MTTQHHADRIPTRSVLLSGEIILNLLGTTDVCPNPCCYLWFNLVYKVIYGYMICVYGLCLQVFASLPSCFKTRKNLSKEVGVGEWMNA
jgi:hypothetical protein